MGARNFPGPTRRKPSWNSRFRRRNSICPYEKNRRTEAEVVTRTLERSRNKTTEKTANRNTIRNVNNTTRQASLKENIPRLEEKKESGGNRAGTASAASHAYRFMTVFGKNKGRVRNHATARGHEGQ